MLLFAVEIMLVIKTRRNKIRCNSQGDIHYFVPFQPNFCMYVFLKPVSANTSKNKITLGYTKLLLIP